MGLVGESGCGKTTTGRATIRLLQPDGGSVSFDGQDIFALSPNKLRRLRRHMQIVFQDPIGSLNPRMTVGDSIAEPMIVHRVARGRVLREQVAMLLERVGLSPDDMHRFPHEFSGGQCQRIGIARAIALKPKLIVCDEPVSALDVSVQSQILNLLSDLQRSYELTYLFIAHDITVVRHFCDEIAVMYLGKIVEQGAANVIHESPKHPYTQALISSAPVLSTNGQSRQRVVLESEVPSPIDPPSGCHFHPRCPFADEKCRTESPGLIPRESAAPNQLVACHYADQDLDITTATTH